MDALSITTGRPDMPDVSALLMRHHALMRAGSPAESCHVMDVSELLAADVTLLVARRGSAALGVAALKVLSDTHGELKSMHTAEEARGQGVAQSVLDALIETGRSIGLGRLSLETGTAEMFIPARAFYARNSFAVCPPFGTYQHDPLSVFMTRTI